MVTIVNGNDKVEFKFKPIQNGIERKLQTKNISKDEQEKTDTHTHTLRI